MVHSHVLGSGNGPTNASITFVAEAVGRRGGAVTGVPLTRDESGRRFESFLRIAGIERDDVFITNAVLCNPVTATGANQPPLASEIERCRPFLARTLALVASPLVVALGRVALRALDRIEPHAIELSRDVGQVCPWGGRALVPLYHPSRQSTLPRTEAAQQDDWRRLGAVAAALRQSHR